MGGFPSTKTSRIVLLVARRGVTVTRIDKQVCEANWILFRTFVVPCGIDLDKVINMSLSCVSL